MPQPLRTAALLTAAALILSSCASQPKQPKTLPEVSPQVKLTAAGKSRPLRGGAPMTLTAKRTGPGGIEQQIKGALCTLTSDLFTAQVETPAKLNLPSFGANGPAMNVSCTYKGNTVTKDQRLRNLTELAYSEIAVGQMFVGFGIIGAAVTAGQASSRNKANDVYGYPSITLTFP